MGDCEHARVKSLAGIRSVRYECDDCAALSWGCVFCGAVQSDDDTPHADTCVIARARRLATARGRS